MYIGCVPNTKVLGDWIRGGSGNCDHFRSDGKGTGVRFVGVEREQRERGG